MPFDANGNYYIDANSEIGRARARNRARNNGVTNTPQKEIKAWNPAEADRREAERQQRYIDAAYNNAYSRRQQKAAEKAANYGHFTGDPDAAMQAAYEAKMAGGGAVYGGGLDDGDYRDGGYIYGEQQLVDPITGGNIDPYWNQNVLGIANSPTIAEQYARDVAMRSQPRQGISPSVWDRISGNLRVDGRAIRDEWEAKRR